VEKPAGSADRRHPPPRTAKAEARIPDLDQRTRARKTQADVKQCVANGPGSEMNSNRWTDVGLLFLGRGQPGYLAKLVPYPDVTIREHGGAPDPELFMRGSSHAEVAAKDKQMASPATRAMSTRWRTAEYYKFSRGRERVDPDQTRCRLFIKMNDMV